ncbi:MAG: hypothetical protein HC912_03690 [Saprospiraceae bacterium]|nr:hypothetical protein [Saprospiraceae bacterium]
MENIFRIDTISMLHDVMRLPPPKHPLITVVNFSNLDDEVVTSMHNVKVSSAFYSITLKKLKKGSLKYGRNQLDFQEGSLFFASPHQIGEFEDPRFQQSTYNWGLFLHPDLIYGTNFFSK